MKSLILKVLLVVTGISASALALEGAFRLQSKPAAWSDRPLVYYKHESSRDLRDQRYEVNKPASVFRIAVVGDSITFAPRMNVDDAFPAKLQRILSQNRADLKPEVINLGHSGFSTRDEVPLVKQAIRMNADLVILQMTLNDAELFALRNGSTYVYQPNALARHSRVVDFIESRLFASSSRDRYRKYFEDLYQDPKGMKVFDKAVRKIAFIGKHSKVPVVPVLFPLFGFQLDRGYPFRALHKKIAETFAKQNVEVLDLLHSFEGIPVSHLQVLPGQDFHPNEIAHRIAAERIYLYLRDQKLIPGDLVIRDMLQARVNEGNEMGVRVGRIKTASRKGSRIARISG